MKIPKIFELPPPRNSFTAVAMWMIFLLFLTEARSWMLAVSVVSKVPWAALHANDMYILYQKTGSIQYSSN